jgi:hypothetical protein
VVGGEVRGEIGGERHGEEVMSAEAGPIRILAVDDHPVVRQGIAGLVAVHSDMSLVAEASNGARSDPAIPCASSGRHADGLGKGRESEIGQGSQSDPNNAAPSPSYSETHYSYQYDQHDNWIEKVESQRSSPDGPFQSSPILKRTLAYY